MDIKRHRLVLMTTTSSSLLMFTMTLSRLMDPMMSSATMTSATMSSSYLRYRDLFRHISYDDVIIMSISHDDVISHRERRGRWKPRAHRWAMQVQNIKKNKFIHKLKKFNNNKPEIAMQFVLQSKISTKKRKKTTKSKESTTLFQNKLK